MLHELTIIVIQLYVGLFDLVVKIRIECILVGFRVFVAKSGTFVDNIICDVIVFIDEIIGMYSFVDDMAYYSCHFVAVAIFRNAVKAFVYARAEVEM